MFEVQNTEESANALSTSADPADFQPFQSQTGNQEEIHSSRAERVPGNISMDHRVS